MSEDPEDHFIQFIKSTLEKNGFPQKKVSLPRAKVESAAEEKGLDLDIILSRIKMGGIYSDSTAEKIIFSYSDTKEPSGTENLFNNMDGMKDLLGGLDLGALQNMSQEELAGQVSQLMGNMTPEQQQAMMAMYENMSEEDKANIMEKGKDIGLF